ncbi:MAG: ParB/RepB/Spo0J family partition protein [Spirochaetota bacterium]
MSKRRLGKGIDALLQGRPLDQLQQMTSIVMVGIDDISPNPDQPRKRFSETSLAELADSIRERGIIQPILAEDTGDGTYVIVAGERRYRAAKLAGLTEVPVIAQELTEEEMLEVALVENIQREDLNPIDEARALQSALDQSGATQDQLAKRLGKSRSAIANSLRLLRLDDDMQDALSDGTMTPGHARALLALTGKADRRRLFERIRDEGLSVREVEAMVKGGSLDETALDRLRAGANGEALGIAEDEQDRLEVPEDASGGGPGRSAGRTTDEGHGGSGGAKSPELRAIEDKLVEHFGTKVVIRGGDTQGRIEIAYFTTEDLERVLESMGVRLGE